MGFGRRIDDDGHLSVGDRIGRVEAKVDRLYWLIVATLAATLGDLLSRVGGVK